jgi:hypothetical protein
VAVAVWKVAGAGWSPEALLEEKRGQARPLKFQHHILFVVAQCCYSRATPYTYHFKKNVYPSNSLPPANSYSDTGGEKAPGGRDYFIPLYTYYLARHSSCMLYSGCLAPFRFER